MYGPGKAYRKAQGMPPGCRAVQAQFHPEGPIGTYSSDASLPDWPVEKPRIKGIPRPFMKDLYQMYGPLIPFWKVPTQFFRFKKYEVHQIFIPCGQGWNLGKPSVPHRCCSAGSRTH